MSDWIVHHGDCLSILPTLASGSVDCVITDPPYGIDFQSAWRIESQRFDRIANDKEPATSWITDAARLLKPDGIVLCFCRWDTAEEFRAALESGGLHVVSQIVWDRVSHGMGDPRTFPSPQHDIIWFARKGRFEFPGARPSSVFRFDRVPPGDLLHPNEKPVGLMASLVRYFSSRGAAILDPFCGSGTTGVACIQTGRRFIGIEISEEYVNVARRRIGEAANHLFAEPTKAREIQGELIQ